MSTVEPDGWWLRHQPAISDNDYLKDGGDWSLEYYTKVITMSNHLMIDECWRIWMLNQTSLKDYSAFLTRIADLEHSSELHDGIAVILSV